MQAHLILLLYPSFKSYFLPIPLVFLFKSRSYSYQFLSLLAFAITSVSLFTAVYNTIPYLPLLYKLSSDLYCSVFLHAYYHISYITKTIFIVFQAILTTAHNILNMITSSEKAFYHFY